MVGHARVTLCRLVGTIGTLVRSVPAVTAAGVHQQAGFAQCAYFAAARPPLQLAFRVLSGALHSTACAVIQPHFGSPPSRYIVGGKFHVVSYFRLPTLSLLSAGRLFGRATYPAALRVCGYPLQLYVNNPLAASVQQEVEGEVIMVRRKADLIYLKLKGDVKLEHPPAEHSAAFGMEYLLVGASICQGRFLDTAFTTDTNMYGDTPAHGGDSGGACFSMRTGKLIAINLGEREGKAVLQPVAIALTLLL